MPPAKKSTSRRTAPAKKSGTGSITRREVEAATKKFDKALDDAGTTLHTMGSNFGRNAKSSYREIEGALKALRRDAAKANRTVMKDLEKVWAAAGSATTATRSRATRTTTKAAAAKPSTARSTASKSTASKPRSTAAKSTGTRSTAARSSATAKSGAAKSRTAAKAGTTRKSAASRSKSTRGS